MDIEEMEVPIVSLAHQINIGSDIQGLPIKIETVMDLEEIEKAKIGFQNLINQAPLDMLRIFRTMKVEPVEVISFTESHLNYQVRTEWDIESPFIASIEVPNSIEPVPVIRMERYI